MDELILPPDCKYVEKHRWVCNGVELIVGSEDEEHYEEEYFEDCGSDLIPAEFCTKDYYEEEEEHYEEEDYEEYEDY